MQFTATTAWTENVGITLRSRSLSLLFTLSSSLSLSVGFSRSIRNQLPTYLHISFPQQPSPLLSLSPLSKTNHTQHTIQQEKQPFPLSHAPRKNHTRLLFFFSLREIEKKSQGPTNQDCSIEVFPGPKLALYAKMTISFFEYSTRVNFTLIKIQKNSSEKPLDPHSNAL